MECSPEVLFFVFSLYISSLDKPTYCQSSAVTFTLCVLVIQSCLTLCDTMDGSPPGSSVHGTSRARILTWVAFSSPRNLPDPGIKLGSPALQADSLLPKPPGKLAKIHLLSWVSVSWYYQILAAHSRCLKRDSWYFPGGPVVRTLCFNCRWHWFDHYSVNQDKILQVAQSK